MAAAQCRSSKCTAERKGFRRELDSWRHKLLHCVGFESILAGIYGPMLLRDLNIFDDCEPEALEDWSFEGTDSLCSFCNLQLDKLNDHISTAASPLSSPSDDPSTQAPPLHMTDSCLSAHRFLQAVFHGKDVTSSYDSHIPAAAQELMKKMICQFAVEYASQSNLFNSRTSLGSTSSSDTVSPRSDLVDPDIPLDLTVSRNQDSHQREPQTDCVLDLSKRKSTSPATSSPTHPKPSGRPLRRLKEEYAQRSWELSEGLLSKALRDVRSGSLEEHRAALLYGIPPRTLRRGLEGEADEGLGLLRCLTPSGGPAKEDAMSHNVMSSMLGGDARLVLQRVAAWAEIGGAVVEENRDIHLPSSSFQPNSLQRALSLPLAQLRDALQPLQGPTPSLDPLTPLRIPRVRSTSNNLAMAQHHHTLPSEGTTCSTATAAPSLSVFKRRSPLLLDACQGRANRSPHGLRSSSFDDSEEGSDRREKDKQPRKKRGRYRQYDHDLLEEAITMVMAGRLSVSKAQGVYGIPHSTLEYKVKERLGTLKTPPKRKPVTSQLSNCGSGASTGSTNSGTTSAAAVNDATKRFSTTESHM
ncbi:ligand-dependent nuclear receptor corepressor-like protein [Aplochiton taeniatus]